MEADLVQASDLWPLIICFGAVLALVCGPAFFPENFPLVFLQRAGESSGRHFPQRDAPGLRHQRLRRGAPIQDDGAAWDPHDTLRFSSLRVWSTIRDLMSRSSRSSQRNGIADAP